MVAGKEFEAVGGFFLYRSLGNYYEIPNEFVTWKTR